MIIVMKKSATPHEVEHIVEKVKELGLTPHISRGVERTVIGVIGEEGKLRVQPLEAYPGVEQVMAIMKPYKLVSREFQAADSIFDLGNGVKIGGENLVVMAGPCAVEDKASLLEVAKAVKKAGAQILRGGAFKPRTSPYSFQGLGEEGLKYLEEVGKETGLLVVTEVMDTRQVELVAEYADILQIGARNMQNFDLLKAVGDAKKPVLLKRGMAATMKEFLMSAEYVCSRGNKKVILCERGIRTFETHTRNTLDLNVVPSVKSVSHLPIIVDPSHGTGKREYVSALAQAAIAAGADGVMIEVHQNPENAVSDGEQSVTPADFKKIMDLLVKLAALYNKHF
jgi:3-deoxy-7-phosphoheptulonate synthase